jgi:hypothetical protein
MTTGGRLVIRDRVLRGAAVMTSNVVFPGKAFLGLK